MITHEAIVLAGGLGTRLRETVPDLPKPMAPVNGKPFLAYILSFLAQQGVNRVVLSVGYKWESIKNYFGEIWGGINLVYCVEEEPLGTGGAIHQAEKKCVSARYFVLNGDSYLDVNLTELDQLHVKSRGLLSLALKPMKNFDRYGTVEINDFNRITGFREKHACPDGLINAGVYIIEKDLWTNVEVGEKFSFEKEILEKYIQSLPFYGFPFEGTFIDIGIPEDYFRAEKIFK